MFYGHIEYDAGRWERLCEVCLGECCEACDQRGWWLEKDSPSTILAAEPGREGREYFEAYRMLKEYRLAPVEGGTADQAALFLEVVKFCDAVHALYAERKRQQEQSETKTKNRLIKLIGE